MSNPVTNPPVDPTLPPAPAPILPTPIAPSPTLEATLLQNEQLRRERDALNARVKDMEKNFAAVGITADIAEEVKQRMAAGLSQQDAVEVTRRNLEHQRNLNHQAKLAEERARKGPAAENVFQPFQRVPVPPGTPPVALTAEEKAAAEAEKKRVENLQAKAQVPAQKKG